MHDTTVAVNHIFLSLDNPRHVKVESEAQAIERLCAKEDIYPLARDIAKIGLNPLERFALLPIEGGKRTDKKYRVAEGNRRLCALKLLADPDLAPAKLRKSFATLSKEWKPVKTVQGTVFKDAEEVRIWLERIHNGVQGGIGRKSWNAEQKQRFDGGSKNRAAQAVLDYAEREGMISNEDRAGKLTTVQRFLSNEFFRETLGFDQSNVEDVARTRPKQEFDYLVKRFIHDLIGKKDVNSRMNKEQIVEYARALSATPGVTTNRTPAESLGTGHGEKKGGSRNRKRPARLAKVKKVQYEDGIFQALKVLGNEKLRSLYYSICSIELEYHTPIVAIGTWAFFETLTSCIGRHEQTSFDSFLSKSKMQSLGVPGPYTALSEAMLRISRCGNVTKHHKAAVLFNGDQLNNDVVALSEVILKCIEAAGQPTA